MKRIGFLFLIMTITAWAADRTVTLKVKGMSCPLCAGAVEKQLRKIPDVRNVKVHLSKAMATVVADESVADERIFEAVREAGFTPEDIQSVDRGKSK